MLSREVEQFMRNEHVYHYGDKTIMFGTPTFYKEEGWAEGLYEIGEPKIAKNLLNLSGWEAEKERDNYVKLVNPEDETREFDGYRLYFSEHENPFDTCSIIGYSKQENNEDREEYLFTGTIETFAELILLHKLLKIKD